MAESGSSVELSSSLTSSTLPPPRTRIFKIIVIGDSGVGKTCLTYRFCAGKFPEKTEATIGVDFRERLVEIDGETIKVCIVHYTVGQLTGLQIYMYVECHDRAHMSGKTSCFSLVLLNDTSLVLPCLRLNVRANCSTYQACIQIITPASTNKYGFNTVWRLTHNHMHRVVTRLSMFIKRQVSIFIFGTFTHLCGNKYCSKHDCCQGYIG